MCQEQSIKLKFLVILRDPVNRAISDYAQGLYRFSMKTSAKREKPKSFESKVFSNIKKKKVDPKKTFINIGLYANHLKRWLKYFDLNQFHFVSGEKLIKEPWKELRSIQLFLNVSLAIRKKHFWFNETKKFYCLSVVKSKRTEITKDRCLNGAKGRKHPNINPGTISALKKFFSPYNQKFYKMVGRNFGW